MTKMIKKSVAIAKTPALDFGLMLTSSALMLAALFLQLMG